MNIQYTQKDECKHLHIKLNTTPRTLAEELHLTQSHDAIACEVNGTLVDFDTILQENDSVRFISFFEPRGKEVFWHSSAHILAQAILRLYPDAKPTIGPAIEQGFYYDFANLHISEENLSSIEEEIEKIIKENHQTKIYYFSSKQEALDRFSNNKYKCEIISKVPDNQKLTAYSQGEFFDLCRGPHIAKLGKIKALKITKTSGAYWRGDSKNEMLTRIYGISFPDRKLLKEYLAFIEEAKKRDHKILGPKLDLFSLKEEAPGIPFIHPKGMIIWNRLLDFWRQLHTKAGYVEIKTPSMMIRDLWERSGHWQNYRHNMFTSHIEERDFAIKPMNCPGGMLYYKSQKHSYRELPMRVAEIGHVHRFEPSGSLSGLFRVRSFHQDDAHLFLKPEDIQSEILSVLQLTDTIYSTFGLKYELALSTKPEKDTIGSDEMWEIATNGLRKALEENNKPFTVQEGDGAFYGPKIDLKIHDALSRSWQCGTIQLDMALPERFELEYTDSDGKIKRPIIVHRAIFGSIERFFGSLIEFFAGKFPLWLSPRQICIICVADRHRTYAIECAEKFIALGFETYVDDKNESVSKKVREAQLLQYNYILTVGDQEVTNHTLNLRTRDNVVHGEINIASFIAAIIQEVQARSLLSPFIQK